MEDFMIAEALIANQEANRMPDYTGLEKTPTSVRTPPPFSDLHGEREAPSYRHDLPLITTKVRKRADSIDGHILRSLVSLSPKPPLSLSSVDQYTPPVPPPPRLLLPPTLGRQSSHSPSVSPENISCGTSGSSPSNARMGGGLLYSLLVSSDSQNPGNSTATASPSSPNRLIRSNSFVSASAPEMDVCEFSQRPISLLPQWPPPPPQSSPRAPADEHLLHHYEDGGYPNPVKKYKATETYPTQSTRLLDTRHPILPTCRNSRSGNSRVAMQPATGLRRFTFGGYSAPRGERISGLLQHPRVAIKGSVTVPNLIKSHGVGITNRDDTERPSLGSLGRSSSSMIESSSAATSCSTKVLSAPSSSASTPSILFALISSPCVEWSPGLSSASTDSGLDEPLDLTGSALFHKFRPNLPTVSNLSLKAKSTVTSAQHQASPRVQLAKKTARPVQARVTEWLRLALEFVFTSVSSLAVVDGVESWLPLFRATWPCLLVISMAEHALEVVVVERTNHNACDSTQPLSWGEKILRWLLLADGELVPETADQAFADAVIQCLNDLRSEQLTPDEFCLLRRATLMAGYETRQASEEETNRSAVEAQSSASAMRCPHSETFRVCVHEETEQRPF
ncbi:unnamed protein product [Schistocephalus solidus]|uniref:Uncharacterized protein n=1 Tax=Schistocephalus solidus TaxID=70667 RepID=A0A183STS1_SCHSO|nr:unnamed protein product [Schistocephalus solidus]